MKVQGSLELNSLRGSFGIFCEATRLRLPINGMALRISVLRGIAPLFRQIQPNATLASSLTSRPLSQSASCFETFTVQDEDDFKARVTESEKAVIVDFSATWCGPCKMLSPRLDAAVATAGDIDENADIADRYGVQAVPTVIAVRGGEVVDKFVGLIDEDKLGAFVENLKS